MSILDSYRRQLQQKKKELIELNGKKAKKQQEKAKLFQKIEKATNSIKKTKSTGTLKTKSREIEQNQSKIAKLEKEIGDISKKIANKEKEISNIEGKIAQKEKTLNKARENEMAKKEFEQDRDINSIKEQHEKLFKKINWLPEKIVVLFLTSSPKDEKLLQPDIEAREITEMISKARYRNSIEFRSAWAVRTEDVLHAINEYQPSIVHFSGHGSKQDEIIMQDDKGFSKPVSKEAIVQLMKSSAQEIRLVFFSTCFSHNQAEAIVEHVEAAIGMKDSITDEAARKFAAQFYSSISFGHSIKKAFDQAKGYLMMEGISEEDTPALYVNWEINPENIIIVKPLDD